MPSVTKFKQANNLAHLMVLIQLGLASYVVKKYNLEPNLHLQGLFLFALVGIIPLPRLSTNWRQVYLILLSLSAIFYFYSTWEILLISITVIFIIATSIYLRSRWLRYMMLTLMASLYIYFTYYKSIWVKEHILVWGVIGSMFLYRIFYFQYSLNFINNYRQRLSQGLSYFFLLPQIVMVLFPPIAPKNILQGQFSPYSLQCAQQGIGWIAIGIIHLLLYRIIYIWFYIPASKVTSILDFAGHTCTNYLLLLRWSGIIYIAIGLLQSIGHRVPIAFNNYFLASGFADFCRRFYIPLRIFLIRIFYKKFLHIFRNVSYLPVQTGAILFIFFCAWMLHSAQWFILNGHFPLRIVDMLFWIILGLLVAFEIQYFRKNKQRTNLVNISLRMTIGNTLRIIITFSGMSLIYGLSSSHSLTAWLELSQLAVTSTVFQWMTFSATILFIVFALMVYLYFRRVIKRSYQYNTLSKSLQWTYWPVPVLILLIALQNNELLVLSETKFSFAARKILRDGPGKSDDIAMAGGYYSELINRSSLQNRVLDISLDRKEQFEYSEGAIEVNDFRLITLRSNYSFTFKGKIFSINAMGFRDKDYPREPAPNAIRTIFLGSSFVVGSGVADEDVFDQVLEKRMNKSSPLSHYEFINGGCSTYDLINCIVRFDNDSLYHLNPDYLFIFSHGVDVQKNIKDIVNALQSGISLPYPYLENIVNRSGIKPEMSQAQMTATLEPFGQEIIKKSYEILYNKCFEQGIQPVFVYWPTVGMRPTMNLEIESILPVVVSIGYQILDLRNVYSGYDPNILYVAPNDRHPNALGHQLVAEELHRIFEETQLLKPTNMPPSKIPVQ